MLLWALPLHTSTLTQFSHRDTQSLGPAASKPGSPQRSTDGSGTERDEKAERGVSERRDEEGKPGDGKGEKERAEKRSKNTES